MNAVDQTISLRPHHGLCIRYFVGKGYSEAFTAHMTEVIEALNDEQKVKLITGADTICSACPNWNGKRCLSDEKVMTYDQRVLTAIGFDPEKDSELSYKELQERIQKQIFDCGLFEKICGDCSWGELCHKAF